MTTTALRPTRVCLVAPKYLTGGQAVAARTLCEGFTHDAQVRIELQPIDPRLPGWLARIRGLRTLARMPLFLAGLIRRIVRADVVHVCSAGFSPFLLTTTPTILIARLLRRPVILNYRDGRAARHLPAAWVRWVMRRTSAIVVPSGFLAHVFDGFGLRTRIVRNVVEASTFRFRSRTVLRPVLVSCRSLEALYAVENTIRAFAGVKDVHPEARLIVIGDGDQVTPLRALVENENIDSVEFVGARPHRELGQWFDGADIFVNSSRIDNMPHSIIEAFSAGLPVVTTNAGGIPWIVEHERNGLLVEIDNPQAMTEAVLRLLREPQLAERLIAEGRQDCVEKYSWEAVRRDWTGLYAELCGRTITIAEPAEAATLPHMDIA